MTTATRQPAESTMTTARPAVRWVKVAWLGSLLTVRGQPDVRAAAADALASIDNDSPRALAAALRRIASAATLGETRDVASDAAECVERAMQEGAR